MYPHSNFSVLPDWKTAWRACKSYLKIESRFMISSSQILYVNRILIKAFSEYLSQQIITTHFAWTSFENSVEFVQSASKRNQCIPAGCADSNRLSGSRWKDTGNLCWNATILCIDDKSLYKQIVVWIGWKPAVKRIFLSISQANTFGCCGKWILSFCNPVMQTHYIGSACLQIKRSELLKLYSVIIEYGPR